MGAASGLRGVDRSAKPQLPLIAINTTAGTASEMTRFCIITDESRQVKMAIIDKHVTPLMSVNDPELMLAKPAGLTAATGMDALTHAIEAYVSTAATPVTDASAVMAIALIAEHLRTAVHQGRISMPVSRWPMPSSWPAWPSTTQAWAMCTPWLISSGGFYDLTAHGVCNAVLLPHVQAYNARCAPAGSGDVARHMGWM